MKIAVVGCRGFGNVHLKAYQQIRKEIDLETYVFSRDINNAKQCMNEFEANGYFISYDNVLSSDVDVVDLIVSHDSHESMGRSAMESGKHLMLEKPIGRTEEEGISLIETSNKTKVKFMVMENHYFDPSVWKAKELMAKLGRISAIIVRNTRFNSPSGWRRNKVMMGGGALIDGGIHYVDTLLNLGGEYKRIEGLCKSTFAGLEGEDTTEAIFDFGGFLGTLIYSWATESRYFPRFEIYGEHGSIVEDYKSRTSEKPYGNLILQLNGDETETIEVKKVNTVEEEIKGFLQSLIEGKNVPMNPTLALRDLKAVINIYRSCGEI
jgi:predicted dehydrogenase